MDFLRSDLRYALRQLRLRPIVAVVAAASLAVGVGANTAIFSAANALLLRPVPGVSEPGRVVELGRTTQGRGFDTFAYPDYLDLREGTPALESIAAYGFASFSFATEQGGVRIAGLNVAADYFSVLGLDPALGRFFGAEEESAGAPGTVVVLDHAFWTGRLGGDPNVVGTTLRLNRVPFTVVGVLPEGFGGHTTGFRPAVYVPLRSSPLLREQAGIWEDRGSSWHLALGRLAEDATVDQARAQVAAVYGRLAEAYPVSNRNRGGALVELGPVPGAGRGPVAGFVGVLLALTALILLATCVNVAGMLLARSTARTREIAVRLAIGSGRARLVRQLLTEALVVFAVGGLVGGAFGAWILGILPVDRLPVPVTLEVDLSPDPAVLLFALAVTLTTGVAFGLMPALSATRLDLTAGLRDEGAGSGRSGLLRRLFLSGQVATSLVLLVAAGLLLRSLHEASTVSTGFDPTGTYMTALDLGLEGYDEQTGPDLQERLIQAVAAIPGVEHAAFSLDLPLDMGRHGTSAEPDGWADPEGRVGLGVDFSHVSPAYFDALAIPLLEGRTFSPGDGPGTEPVVVVSRALVERVWPDASPVGRAIRVGGEEEARTVVGVVENVKNQMITDVPEPFVYLPLGQAYRASGTLLARARPGFEEQVAEDLRAAVLSVDPSLSVPVVTGVEEYTALGTLPQRVAASITSVLGAFALLLSGLGIYGVVAYSVGRRTREIGIRMALGAGRLSVITGVIRGGLRLTLPGLLLGVAGALGTGRVMGFLLLGTDPADPIALGGVTGGMLLVITLAAALPARRASRVTPVEALRNG